MRCSWHFPLAVFAALVASLMSVAPAGAQSPRGPSLERLQDDGLREIIVTRRPRLTAARRGQLRADAGAAHVRNLRLADTEVVRVARGRLVAAMAELDADPDVRRAVPNIELHTATQDSYWNLLWGLSNTGQNVNGVVGTPGADIDVLDAWPLSLGAGQTVAVIDTGVDLAHEDLVGQLATNPGETGGGKETNGVDDDGDGLVDDWQGWDWVDHDNVPTDLKGHGTHVAGTIAATRDNGRGITGVAPAAKVYPLRVLDATGSGPLADVIDAFDLAGDMGIPVVNASLGAAGSPATVPMFGEVVASHPDTLYVVAAGNGGEDGIGDDNDVAPQLPCNLTEDNVVCVAASDSSDARASFSNYGSQSVDLYAPGVGIASSYPAVGDWTCGHACYVFSNGTSMATPHVAGVAALMRAADPTMSATEIKARLLAGVDVKPALAGTVVSGGRLNAAAAVIAVLRPENTDRPTIAGDAAVGETLTKAGDGDWTRSPTSYRYQWQRRGTGAWADINGATDTSYVIVGADTGAALRLTVTAANGSVTGTAASDPTAVVAPVNTAAPTVAGSAADGQRLTVDPGSWTGSPSFTYRWQREDAGQWSDLDGATSASYTAGLDDVGHALRATVLATQNGAPSSPAISAATAGVIAVEPVNQAAPTLSAGAAVGQSLSVVDPGVWAPSATTYAYQWQRGFADRWVDVPSATSEAYTVVGADTGSALRLRVSAQRGALSSSAVYTPATDVIAPANVDPPIVTGSVRVGETLRADDGRWTGSPAFARQWQRCDGALGACETVGTEADYAIVGADAGHVLRLRVTATQNGASAEAVSSATTPVAAPPADPIDPPAEPAPTAPESCVTMSGDCGWPALALHLTTATVSGRISVCANRDERARRCRPRTARLTFTLDHPARVRITFTRRVCGRRLGHRRCVYRRVAVRTVTGGAGRNRVTLTRRVGRRTLSTGRYRITVRASSGTLRSKTLVRSVTVR